MREVSLPATQAFDYASLEPDAAAAARGAASRIRQNMKAAIIDVGRDLTRVKDLLPHGHFGAWLKAEFPLTNRAAQLYMNAARLVDECETVSLFRAKTIYTLASGSTPDKARAQVLDRLRAGEVVSDKAVDGIIWKARSEQYEAERQAEEAKRSPRARRRGLKLAETRAACRAEFDRVQKELKAKREALAQTAADLFLETVPFDTCEKLLQVVLNGEGTRFIELLQEGLSRAVTPKTLAGLGIETKYRH